MILENIRSSRKCISCTRASSPSLKAQQSGMLLYGKAYGEKLIYDLVIHDFCIPIQLEFLSANQCRASQNCRLDVHKPMWLKLDALCNKFCVIIPKCEFLH